MYLMKRALITGVTGQDGSYLAEFLLDKGYEVHGIVRRSSVHTTSRIDHLIADGSITLHDGDLADSSSLVKIVTTVKPDEIYNLQLNTQETWMLSVSFAFSRQRGSLE